MSTQRKKDVTVLQQHVGLIDQQIENAKKYLVELERQNVSNAEQLKVETEILRLKTERRKLEKDIADEQERVENASANKATYSSQAYRSQVEWLREVKRRREELDRMNQRNVPERLQTIEVPEISRPDLNISAWQEQFNIIGDLASNLNTMLVGSFDRGIEAIARSWYDGTASMGQMFSEFAKQALAELTAIIIKTLFWKAIAGVLDLGSFGLGSILSGGGAGSLVTETPMFGKTAGGLQRVGGLSTQRAAIGAQRPLNVSFNVSTMDASSFKQWLARTDVRGSLIGSIREAIAKEKA